ncbi:ATP-binding cassette domain-containing protein [Candidatus Villigracilis saccharophilus]|uniref:ATP-binding cassette domain-containing protein n=1 Tax=Candidatus Villigracilis saccharophilus TaxID=3140684 RepID=UPI0031366B6E|nr:ATP-binding cassette domain-containing protein [Anaerolineales bacterium]
MLQVKNLTKIYDGKVKALNNVSFEVPDGQFLAVIGFERISKSTLLRCINRLISHGRSGSYGTVKTSPRHLPEEMRRIRRKIGMVFQHFNLVHRSKVITNVLAGRLSYPPRVELT